MTEWRKNYPESERPSDDAGREVHWVQGGVPIARMKLIKKEDGGLGVWSLGNLEPSYFGGKGVELCWWLWARDKAEVSDRYARMATRMADELESAARALRKVAQAGPVMP